MKICEIYKSINGESTQQGLPVVILRMWGCNLNCSYCDTKYARENPFKSMGISEIIKELENYSQKSVLITGGEPLIQYEIFSLIKSLLKRKYRISLETNGSFSIHGLSSDIKRIVDVKCPSSNESGSFCMDNLRLLTDFDEIKFVIASYEDYEFSKIFIKDHLSSFKGEIIFSPAIPFIEPRLIAEQIIGDNINVRFQIQLHKVLWGDQRKR